MEALIHTSFVVASALIALSILFFDGKMFGWGLVIAALGLITAGGL